MNVEQIAAAIHKLSDEERLRLIRAVGPDLCDTVMKHPEAMADLMSGCCGMAGCAPDMMARMQEMMSGRRGRGARPPGKRP